MSVDFDSVFSTLSLIYGENNIRKVSDKLIVYRADGKIGYYDLVNDNQIDPMYNKCAMVGGAILCDNSNEPRYGNISFNNISFDTFKSSVLHIMNCNYLCNFDVECCLIKIPKSSNLFLIKSRQFTKVFHVDKPGAITEIPLSVPDKNIYIYGDPKFIVVNWIEPDGTVVGITDEGEVGDVEVLLRKKYPNIKVEKRGKASFYTVETEDGTYYLNRLGNLY